MSAEIIRLVSIIIPAYNAAGFIEETLRSIFRQTYTDWEIIVVNDGSTDNTREKIEQLNVKGLTLISQQNSGVASARNTGLSHARGEFVIFFDADDLMTEEFLASRVKVLNKNPGIDYVGGLVQTFPLGFKMKKAAASNPEKEILFFDPSFVTVPSNYVLRRKALIDNGIAFNNELSSTADRFFILELSKYSKGKHISDETGKLLYRFSQDSMSNKVTPGLIIDNEKFYFELKRKKLLPRSKKQEFKSFYFFSLAIGFSLVKYWDRSFKYLFMSMTNHPLFFAKAFGKRIISFSGLDRKL